MKNIILPPAIRLKGDKYIGLFPAFVVKEQAGQVGMIQDIYYRVLLFLLKYFILLIIVAERKHIKKFLNKKRLSQQEVGGIYQKIASKYEFKHHFTTHYRDTWWRRQAGIEIANFWQGKQGAILKLLDVGTGIGLSIEEMFKVFKLFNIKATAVGFDFSPEMLFQAKNSIYPRMVEHGLIEAGAREVNFIRGDAHYLAANFNENTFDVITNVFALGGIEQPLHALKQQLKVLKADGMMVLVDIHRPIVALDEHYPWFIRKSGVAYFALKAWESVTEPLVLRTIWGWHDPTYVFYLAKYLTYIDEKNSDICYGFEQITNILNNESWWFRIPVMTTARLVLQKKRITREEHEKRKIILSTITF